MWVLDFPEYDPDSNYPEPTASQHRHAEDAYDLFEALRSKFEKMTVPQQRKVLNRMRDELVGGVCQDRSRYHPHQAVTKPK